MQTHKSKFHNYHKGRCYPLWLVVTVGMVWHVVGVWHVPVVRVWRCGRVLSVLFARLLTILKMVRHINAHYGHWFTCIHVHYHTKQSRTSRCAVECFLQQWAYSALPLSMLTTRPSSLLSVFSPHAWPVTVSPVLDRILLFLTISCTVYTDVWAWH